MSGSLRALALLLGAVAVCASVASASQVTLISYIGLAGLVTVGLVVLIGIAGLTSFGQAAFAGVGAYTSAVLCTQYGVSPWLGLVAGLVVVCVISVALGAATMSLHGPYFPLGTMAWGISFYYLFANIPGLGGNTGISEIPPIEFFGVSIGSERRMAFMIWVFLAVAAWLTFNLLDSRTGRAVRALRSGEMMAEAFGVNTTAVKVKVFIYVAALAAVSGWLYAHMLQFVGPASFSINVSIQYIFMIVVGGSTSIWGGILGAAILISLKEILQPVLPMIFGEGANYELIFFGLIVIWLLHKNKRGLAPLLSRWVPYFLRSSRESNEASAAPLPYRAMPERGHAILKVHHVRKSFGGLAAVKDISFDLHAGEILGLVGPNGAGKSTTFNLISGVLPVSAGRIEFLGGSIEQMRSRKIARLGIARTFQHVRIQADMPVIDNVALGGYLRNSAGFFRALLQMERKEEHTMRAEAMRHLELVGLADHALDAAGSLPLGKQRLLEIARALCADPLLLLLDEPAAGLRRHEKLALFDVLCRLRNRGMAILLVEHDMEFVGRLVDRMIVMDFGQKIAEGAPSSVRKEPAVIEAYMGAA